MSKKKYIVALTAQERQQLEQLTKTGKAPAYKINHARIWLKADIHQAGGGWPDKAISQALDLSVSTIERVRQRLVEQSLEQALSRNPQQRRKARLLDGEQEAQLVALACSDPPEGQAQWSLRLLAERMVSLEYVETISYETVRQTLQKTHLSLG